MSRQLSEIAFFTSDVAAMTAHYRAVLQSDPVHSTPDMAIFMSGPTKIFIHRTYQPAEGDLPPENHFAITVANLDAAVAELEAAGVTLEVPPQEYYWGTSAYLRDPDGHLLELIEAEEEEA